MRKTAEENEANRIIQLQMQKKEKKILKKAQREKILEEMEEEEEEKGFRLADEKQGNSQEEEFAIYVCGACKKEFKSVRRKQKQTK